MPKFSSLRLFDISFLFYFKGHFAKDIIYKHGAIFERWGRIFNFEGCEGRDISNLITV